MEVIGGIGVTRGVQVMVMVRQVSADR
ncbi:hypothetical protein E2C01_082214 [Portunus trituberculatus]|uniref:Uncharacterized protein n=1 Tax=Portunus trituberculatus TaxID=210409 RepID=A0A5B7IYL1_PORTR|nr:hypothetical protein [Portunus trituberculatus]